MLIFSNLEYLYLNDNPLMAIPEAITRLPKMKHLGMKNTAITVLSHNPFAYNHNLDKIEFDSMPNLTAIGPNAFSNYPNLKDLNFAESQKLSSINEAAFGYPIQYYESCSALAGIFLALS